MSYILIILFAYGSLLIAPVTASATDYHVGPGQKYATIGAVPWYTLAAGDTVYIHYATYHEKFQVSTRGTAQNPIRVIGVLDSNGKRPVIDGQNATTSSNNHHRWKDPKLVQSSGVVFINVNSSNTAPLPGYIEIKNLEISNGYMNNNFTAEDGTVLPYSGFAAGIYIRSAEHVLIENCVIHDNGQGIYNWTGSGSNWWDGLAKDLIIRGNYFFHNGVPKDYSEHQTYTEADGVIIEYNHYGPTRSGAWGSQLKDRSAGTVIRYNYFDSAPSGWYIDLVEPQESWSALGKRNKFKQTFVYGNVVINNGNYKPNYFHWNEDTQMKIGRATVTGGRLLFYNNTVLTVADRDDFRHSKSFHLFNTTFGAYDCPPGSPPGVIDLRNNIFAVLPRTAGRPVPTQKFAYCNNQNLHFGVNWVSPGWVSNTGGTVTGSENVYSPASNDPGFNSSSSPFDLHLSSGSGARNKGGASAPEMTKNYLGWNLAPIAQYVVHQLTAARSGITSLGAFE